MANEDRILAERIAMLEVQLYDKRAEIMSKMRRGVWENSPEQVRLQDSLLRSVQRLEEACASLAAAINGSDKCKQGSYGDKEEVFALLKDKFPLTGSR